MNIEESISKLKRQITIGKCERNIGIPAYISDLENLLTDYEEKCKKIKKEIQDDLDVRNRWGLTLQELEKEKEKNKKARYYIYDALNNDDIINVGIDDMKIILDMLEE